jgi:peptidoglycan/xylan/chitin deacetylase (PgdA/CDA1 family)
VTSVSIILMYHRISEEQDPWQLAVSPAHFAEHLEVLATEWRPIALSVLCDRLAETDVPHRSVVVTFDDGYADNLYAAAPLLERRGVPATFFLVSGAVGSSRPFWWDELDSLLLQSPTLPPRIAVCVAGSSYEWDVSSDRRPPTDDGRSRTWRAVDEPRKPREELYRSLYGLVQPLDDDVREDVLRQIRSQIGRPRSPHRPLTAEEAHRLAAVDGADVGAHTVTHPLLASLAPRQQAHELRESRRSLEESLERPVVSMSYPYGGSSHYTLDSVRAARACGYRCACAAHGGAIVEGCDRFRLPRVPVVDEDGDAFARLLAGVAAEAGTP